MTEPALDVLHKFPPFDWPHLLHKLQGGQNILPSKFFTHLLHILSPNMAGQYIPPKCQYGSFLQGAKPKQSQFSVRFFAV